MTLAESVRSSIKAMTWLEESDRATAELAVTYAEQVDVAVESGDPEAARSAMYLGPHLLNALRSLGGTPAERKALGVESKARGKLALLRDAREHRAS